MSSLATPAAIVFLLGLALVYFALRGFDEKHKLFSGKLSK